MTRVRKPQGLIRYRSLTDRSARLARPRVLVYMALIAVLASILVVGFVDRAPSAITILRAADSPYQRLPEARILNHFKVHLHNQSQAAQEFELSLPSETANRGVKLTKAPGPHVVPAGKQTEVHFFLSFPGTMLDSRGESRAGIVIDESRLRTTEARDVVLVGPRP